MRHEGADRHGDERCEEERREPGDAEAHRELREGHRADAGEDRVAQRHLAAGPHEESEREHQDRLAEPEGVEGQLGAHEVRHEQQHGEHDRSDAGSQFDRPRPLERRTSLGFRTEGQPPLRERQQHDEQDQERQGVGKAAERGPVVLVHQVAEHVLENADDEAADEGDRDAGETADRGGAERIGGEEREGEGLEADDGKDQHA